jgi:predicted amidophosphoribosyltransferase
MVAGLKFQGARGLARPMAAQIAAAAPRGLLAGVALVPVPLHPRRAASRGYNQAFELADRLARLTGLPLADCLERSGPPTTQVGRGREERAHSISGRVRVEAGRQAPNSVLIVDDVITTGSTVGACAQALRAAGTVHVTALAYARTIGR